jgi:hypothetical protein
MMGDTHVESAVPEPHAEAAQHPSQTCQENRLQEPKRDKPFIGKALRQTICKQKLGHDACPEWRRIPKQNAGQILPQSETYGYA